MDHIGIDLHKKDSQMCILVEGGELLERRIRTDPRRFAEMLGERAPACILLEASTESEWVARCLAGLGHDVVVADPHSPPCTPTRTRKVKTDRRDARALAEACLLGAYRPAHRLSDASAMSGPASPFGMRWCGLGRATSRSSARCCASTAGWCPRAVQRGFRSG